MAFPTVAGRQDSQSTTDKTSHTVDFDTTPTDGDLLVVFVTFDGVPTITWPAGWTQIAANSTGANKGECRYRVASADSASIALSTNVAEEMEARAYRLTVGTFTGVPEAGSATGASANPNPPSLSPTWGSSDNLWLAWTGNDGASAASGYPSSYTNTGTQNSGGATGAGMGYAERQNATGTEDPGTFTITSDDWIAITAAVQGVMAAFLTPAALALSAVFPTGQVEQTIPATPLALAPTFPITALGTTFAGSALALGATFPTTSLVLEMPLSPLALAPTFPSVLLDRTVPATALALAPTFPASSLAIGLTGSPLALAVGFPATDVDAPAPPPASEWDVSFWLFDAAHAERWPVFPIDGAFGHDETMNGTASLTFPYTDDAVSLFLGGTVGQEFPDVTLRCFCRGTRIWTGVAITTRLSTDRGGSVEVTFEHAYQHVQRIRSVYAASVNSFDSTDGADNVLLAVQRAQIGPTPVVPSGHPGTRTDFGALTVTVTAAHSPALAPSARMLEQSGSNLLDVSNAWLEAHDLAPVLTDPSTGAIVLDADYPFESHDVTDLVRFGQWHGNLAKFELVSDRSGLGNVGAVEGKTAKAVVFDSDAPSIALWGEAEFFFQLAQDTNDGSASTAKAAALIASHGSAKLTYRAELIETPGHLFVTDWFWRYRIRLEEAIFGINVEAPVTAWQMQVAGGRMYQLDVVMGEPRLGDVWRSIVERTGIDGPRMMGKYANRRQA